MRSNSLRFAFDRCHGHRRTSILFWGHYMLLQALGGRLSGRALTNGKSTHSAAQRRADLPRPLTEGLESRRYCYGLNANSTSFPGDVYVNDSVRMDLHFDVNCPGVYFEARITFPDSSTTTYDTNYVYTNDWEVDLGYLDTSQAGTMTVELWVEQNPQLMTLEESNVWHILEPVAQNVEIQNPDGKFGETAIASDVGANGDSTGIVTSAPTNADSIASATPEQTKAHRGIFATAMIVIPGAMAAIKVQERRTQTKKARHANLVI